MPVPRIVFNENNVGTQPITTGVRNRIGFVSQFSRGPANQFSFIDGFTDFATRYGSDATIGSMAYQSAYDMGAREFGLIRVLGSDKPACGSIILSGTATRNNQLVFFFNYTGDATPIYPTQQFTPISITGQYTGSVDGRYVLYVDNITAGDATIKYQFIPQTTASSAAAAAAAAEANDWSTISTTIASPVDLDADQGVAKLIENGVSITFSTAGAAGDIVILEEDVFTIRTRSFNYNVDIAVGQTSQQIAQNVIATLSGAEPIGEVTTESIFSGSGSGSYTDTLTFCLNEEFEGNIGNNMYYYVDFLTGDGLVGLEADYDETASATTITTTDANAQYIEFNAAPTTTNAATVTSNAGVLSSATPPVLITNVVEAAGTYTITLNQPLDSAVVGTSGFKFVNPTGGLQTTIFQENESTNFIGGEDGPSNAQLTLYTLDDTPLVSLFAISPGAWGNGLRASIFPLDGAKWRLTITDTQGQNFNPTIDGESFIIDLTAANAIGSNGSLTALANSNLIRGTFLPQEATPGAFNLALLQQKPQRVGVSDPALAGDDTQLSNYRHPAFFGPQNLVDIPFTSGFDGPQLVENDWIKAIRLLESTQTHIIAAPGIYTNLPGAQATLISVAENSSELEGLKYAILSAKPNISVQQASQETLGLDSRRATMIAGWSTYAGQVNAGRFSLSPDALLAGRLGATSFFISPAARSSAGSIQGILEVDTQNINSINSLDILTDARLEVIALDNALRAFYFSSGNTLSSDPAWQRVITRRTYDVVRQDLFTSLQRYKAEPHTRLLRKQVTTAINGYFASMARNGYIANYRSALCDDSNNPPENYNSGELNIDIFFLPLSSADFINITITRTTSAGLSIGEV